MGTKEYKSLVYKVSKVHRYVPKSETNESIKPYEDGIIIEILGFEIYNNVETNTYIESNQSVVQDENKYSFKVKVLKNNGNSNILVKVLENCYFRYNMLAF